MKLKVIVKELDLTVEKEKKVFGDIIEVSEDRAKEILEYRFDGLPVVMVESETDEKLLNTVQKLKETITELENNNSILMEENIKLKETITELEKSLIHDEAKNSQSKKGKEDK